MATGVQIVDLRVPKEKTAATPPKRSHAAHAALAGARLPESCDHDAFMAVYDAASELSQKGELYLGDGTVGIMSRKEAPGRPDLEIVHGRGGGGCSFVMAVRKQPQPARVAVQEKSWADEIELEDALERQTIGVKVEIP